MKTTPSQFDKAVAKLTQPSRFKAWRTTLGVAALSLGLGACTTLLAPAQHLSVFDLGIPVSMADNDTSASPRVMPASIEVRVPSWLASAAMQYQLDYQVPPDRRWYTESRWAAQPSELLQRYLQQAMGYGRTHQSACRLRIEVEEYTQIFSAADESKAHLRGTLLLLAQREDRVVERRSFVVESPAPSPNAQGGVLAHRAVAQQFSAEIGEWLQSVRGTRGEETSLQARCRRDVR